MCDVIFERINTSDSASVYTNEPTIAFYKKDYIKHLRYLKEILSSCVSKEDVMSRSCHLCLEGITFAIILFNCSKEIILSLENATKPGSSGVMISK